MADSPDYRNRVLAAGKMPGQILALAAIAFCLTCAPAALSAEERRPADVCEELPQAARADCTAAAELLMRPSPGDAADLTVWVTAADGMLSYRYQSRITGNQETSKASECETSAGLNLPTGANVSLNVTAEDRIYTWQVSSLGLKVDMVPGRINQLQIARVPFSADAAKGQVRDESNGVVVTTKVRFIDNARNPDGLLRLKAFCSE
jgi:hypothetical protein